MPTALDETTSPFGANVLADGATIRITGDFAAALPTFTLAGFTLTAPGSPTFPATELDYEVSPVIYQGQAVPSAIIGGVSTPVVNDSALSAAAVVVGSQGLNGLTPALANRVAYVGATTGAGSTSGATLAAAVTGAPTEGALVFANATLGELARKFARSGTAITVTPVLPSAPAAAAPVVMGNR